MGTSNRLQQYTGHLTSFQAAEGIRAALNNARSLLADAELLMEKGRWQRAAALAILAIEEKGKVPLLRGLLLVETDTELRKEWRAYRTHVKKNLAYIVPQLAKEGAKKLDDFKFIYGSASDHGQLLEHIKQLAFYTDACGSCHWSVPEEVVGLDLAQTLISIGKILIPAEPIAMTSEAELKIWVKHMRPVWKQSMTEMKRALLACYAEADALGLLQGKQTPRQMISFVL